MEPTQAQKMLSDIVECSRRSKSEEMRMTSEPAVTSRAAMITRTKISSVAAAKRDSNDAYWIRTAGALEARREAIAVEAVTP